MSLASRASRCTRQLSLPSSKTLPSFRHHISCASSGSRKLPGFPDTVSGCFRRAGYGREDVLATHRTLPPTTSHSLSSAAEAIGVLAGPRVGPYIQRYGSAVESLLALCASSATLRRAHGCRASQIQMLMNAHSCVDRMLRVRHQSHLFLHVLSSLHLLRGHQSPR